MIARATAPNRIGPGSVFPDAAKWDFSQGLKGEFIPSLINLQHSHMRIQGVPWLSLSSGLRLSAKLSLLWATSGSTGKNNLVSTLVNALR